MLVTPASTLTDFMSDTQTAVAEPEVPFSEWAKARTYGTPKTQSETEPKASAEGQETEQAAPAKETAETQPEATEETTNKELDEPDDADLAADAEALKNPNVRRHLGGYARVKQQREKAKQTAETLRLENERLKGQIEALTNTSAPKPDTPKADEKTVKAKPKPEDFTSIEDYNEALVDWKVDQKYAAQKEQDQKEKTAEANKQAAAKATNEFDSRVKAVMENPEYADWREVVLKSGAQYPDFIAQAIYKLKQGPQVAYELAKNPDLLKELSALDPAEAIAELGVLNAKYKAKPAEQTKTEPQKLQPQQSAAPRPIRASATPTQTSVKAAEDMSDSEWIRQRNQKAGYR